MHFLCRHRLFSFREILALSCVLGPLPCEAPLESHALRDENRDLAFEGLDYAVAPTLGDGLGHWIRENLLFAFFHAIEDGHRDGLGRGLREIDASGHIGVDRSGQNGMNGHARSEEHTSELQSLAYLVCRLLLEKK